MHLSDDLQNSHLIAAFGENNFYQHCASSWHASTFDLDLFGVTDMEFSPHVRTSLKDPRRSPAYQETHACVIERLGYDLRARTCPTEIHPRQGTLL